MSQQDGNYYLELYVSGTHATDSVLENVFMQCTDDVLSVAVFSERETDRNIALIWFPGQTSGILASPAITNVIDGLRAASGSTLDWVEFYVDGAMKVYHNVDPT